MKQNCLLSVFKSNTNRSLITVICIVSTFGMVFGSSSVKNSTSGVCDVTTGATVSVKGIKFIYEGSTVTATLTWTERHTNGERFFCVGETAPGICKTKVSSRAKGAKDQVIKGLKPQTLYKFRFNGSYKTRTNLSIVTGSFKTDGSACGTSIVLTEQIDGVILSNSNDSLEKAIVKVTAQNGGALIATDTTDASGGFNFEILPGNYFLNVSHPPFTSPAPFAFSLLAGKSKSLEDIILSGAYQLSGTIVSETKADTLQGAKVTLKSPSDATLSLIRTSDEDGHFSYPVKAGDYHLTAVLSGKTYNSSKPITVTQSMDLGMLPLSSTTSLLSYSATRDIYSSSNPSIPHYKANGAKAL